MLDEKQDIVDDERTGFAPLDAAAPVRLDGGVELTGTILLAKGFFVSK